MAPPVARIRQEFGEPGSVRTLQCTAGMKLLITTFALFATLSLAAPVVLADNDGCGTGPNVAGGDSGDCGTPRVA